MIVEVRKETLNIVLYEERVKVREEWRSFKGTHWTDGVDVRDFIQQNYTQYDGDESFLAGPTDATDKLWGRLQELQKEERGRPGQPVRPVRQ